MIYFITRSLREGPPFFQLFYGLDLTREIPRFFKPFDNPNLFGADIPFQPFDNQDISGQGRPWWTCMYDLRDLDHVRLQSGICVSRLITTICVIWTIFEWITFARWELLPHVLRPYLLSIIGSVWTGSCTTYHITTANIGYRYVSVDR